MYLSGTPENMLHKHDVDAVAEKCSANRVLSMVINGAVSYGEDNKTLSMVRGSIACAVADVLESLGYRCEIYCAFGLDRCKTPVNPGRHDIYCKIKEPGEALDLERISFAMCHSSMFRRIAFAVMENIGIDGSCYHGYPHEVEDKGDIYFGELHLGRMSGIEEWVEKALEILKKAGVELQEA
jgi:hypothetical protein